MPLKMKTIGHVVDDEMLPVILRCVSSDVSIEQPLCTAIALPLHTAMTLPLHTAITLPLHTAIALLLLRYRYMLQ